MSNRLDYECTHNKIKNAIESLLETGESLTVKKVADYAGISRSTAYHHKCDEMIRDVYKKKK